MSVGAGFELSESPADPRLYLKMWSTNYCSNAMPCLPACLSLCLPTMMVVEFNHETVSPKEALSFLSCLGPSILSQQQESNKDNHDTHSLQNSTGEMAQSEGTLLASLATHGWSSGTTWWERSKRQPLKVFFWPPHVLCTFTKMYKIKYENSTDLIIGRLFLYILKYFRFISFYSKCMSVCLNVCMYILCVP